MKVWVVIEERNDYASDEHPYREIVGVYSSRNLAWVVARDNKYPSEIEEFEVE